MTQIAGGAYQLKLSHNFTLQDVFKRGHLVGQKQEGLELEMPKSPKLDEIIAQGQADGIDQVYFEVEGKYYMAEGDRVNLKQLKDQQLPQIPILLEGKEQMATIIAKDDEVNTAWEGVKAMGGKTLGFMASGLLGGSVLAGVGYHQVNQGLTLANRSLAVAEQRFAQAGTKVLATQTEVKALETLKSLPASLKKPYQNLLPKMTLTRTISGPSPQPLQKALGQTERAVAYIDQSLGHPVKGANLASKGAKRLRGGLYLAAAGLAIGGTMAVGSAIYGANRPINREALQAFRQQKVNFSTL